MALNTVNKHMWSLYTKMESIEQAGNEVYESLLFNTINFVSVHIVTPINTFQWCSQVCFHVAQKEPASSLVGMIRDAKEAGCSGLRFSVSV